MRTVDRLRSSAYWSGLAAPGMRGLLIGSATGRLGVGMSPLALLFLIVESSAPYWVAGTCGGAFALTAALLGPYKGRWVDRVGVLVPTLSLTLAFIGVTLIAATYELSSSGFIFVGLLAGAGAPPYGAISKLSVSSRVHGGQLRALYSVESAIDVTAASAAPAAVGVAAHYDTPLALVAAASATGIASVVVLLSTSSDRSALRDRRETDAHVSDGVGNAVRGVAWNFRLLLGTSLCMVTGIAMIEVSIPAKFARAGIMSDSGFALALLFVSSALGSLVFGSQRWRRSAVELTAILTILTGLALILSAAVQFPRQLTFVTAILGFAFGPLATSINLSCLELIPRKTLAEGLSRVTAATNFGNAAGFSLGAVLLDGTTDHALGIGVSVFVALGIASSCLLWRGVSWRHSEKLAATSVAHGKGLP